MLIPDIKDAAAILLPSDVTAKELQFPKTLFEFHDWEKHRLIAVN